VLIGQVVGNGEIQGTILDPTGAVIPGATVIGKNEATGVKTTRTATGAGFYVLSPIPAGVYTVTVSSPGFETAVQEHVNVDALHVVGLNITLTVGITTQEVTVTAAPAGVETSNGTLGITLPGEDYTALPIALSGSPMSPEGLIYLLPGVVNGNGFVGNVNGGEAFSKEIYLNGMPETHSELQGDSRLITMNTSVEVVDQFTILTSGAPAYYDGQGTENYTFKSGTNKFHGDGYEYVRNTSLDSRGFYNPTATIEKQNEFGGTIGGPIKKDKIFFFGNYDGFRYHSGSSGGFSSLPTTLEQQGNFSQLCKSGFDASGICQDRGPSGNVINQIYDSTQTQCPTAGTCTRPAFPGNIIPPGEISKIASALQGDGLSSIHLLNQNLQNNYLGAAAASSYQNDVTTKGDFNLSNKNRFFLADQWGHSGSPSPGNVIPLPYGGGTPVINVSDLAQASDTYTITPNLVNVAAVGFFRWYNSITNPTTGGNWLGKAGFQGLSGGNATTAFPYVGFGGPNSPSTWASCNYCVTYSEITQTITVQDNLQWTHGRHNVTIGGSIAWEEMNETQPTFSRFAFGNLETGNILPTGVDPATGNSYASFLLGAVDRGDNKDTSVAYLLGIRNQQYALYAQDDFRVTPRLTLNLGVREYIPTPDTEAFNRQSGLNLTLPNAVADGYPGALQFYGYGPDSCHCKTPIETHYKNIAPRIGLAYKLNDKTVLRGSYGIFYQNAGALGGSSGIGDSSTGFSYRAIFSTRDGGVHPGFFWDSGFPAYRHPPFVDPTFGAGFTTTVPNGNSGFYADPYLSGIPPRMEDWNITIERQLSPSTVVKASYQGSGGHFLPTGVGNGPDSDYVNPVYLPLGGLLTQPYSPATLAQAQAIMPGIKVPYANFSGSIGQMLRPYPQYNGFSQNWGGGEAYGDIGNSNYNAFQLAIQRHMSHGLQFLISYTLSKELDDAGSNLMGNSGAGSRNAYNQGLEYALGNADIPNQLVLSYIYDLPAGAGHWLGGSNAVSRAILSGWKFSGIQSYVQGTPLGPAGANCGSAIGYFGSCYADYTPGFSGPIKINGSYGSSSSGSLLGPTPPVYFDINAFSTPGTFSFGDTPRTNPYRLRNTTWLNENFALMRDIKIREFLTLQFAMQAFNAFNRTQFSAPNLSINSGAFGEIGGQANTPRQVQFNVRLTF
jgi:hypothetical protein